MPTPKLTAEILAAAIEGFEAQKRRIDGQIAELRQMLDGGRTEPAITSEAAETQTPEDECRWQESNFRGDKEALGGIPCREGTGEASRGEESRPEEGGEESREVGSGEAGEEDCGEEALNKNAASAPTAAAPVAAQ